MGKSVGRHTFAAKTSTWTANNKTDLWESEWEGTVAGLCTMASVGFVGPESSFPTTALVS